MSVGRRSRLLGYRLKGNWSAFALQECCQRILEMPVAFPKRDDIRPGFQMGVHGNCLIIFHAESDIVRIERIVHGARQLKGLI